jgi:hypothetical protein
MKKSLFLIFVSLIFIVSCSDKKQIVVNNKNESAIIQNSGELTKEEILDNNFLLEDNNFLLEDNNELILENGDIININKLEDLINIEYSKNNKKFYSLDYFYENDLLNIKFMSHDIVSSLTSDISYLNKVSNIYIQNQNAIKFKFSFEKGNEINIFESEENFEYSNLSNINIKKHENIYSVIVNLTNKDFCNDNNLILFNKDENNANIIALDNKLNFNNLECGKENILLFSSSYSFIDKRNFSLFDNNIVLNSKKDIFEKLNNKKMFINTVKKDNFIYINLNNLDNYNYSLNYEYNKKHKLLNIIINKIPEKWMSIDKIKINKNIFYKIDKFNIIEQNYEDYNAKKSINNMFTDKYKLYSFQHNNDYYYSYINDLTCDYFSDQLLIEINDLEDKSNLILLNDKESQCKKYGTKKIAADYSRFNIKEMSLKEDLLNIGLEDYFNLEYKRDTYYFDYISDYRVYNYKVINNQLYLYVDKPNNDYDILNKPIEILELEQFSNINIINLFKDIKYKEVFDDNKKVYRDFNEKLKANVRKYKGYNDYTYYSLRLNSISLNNKQMSCNDNPYEINKIKEGDKSYSLIIKEDNKNCQHSGVGLLIVKLIGSDVDFDFIEKRSKSNLELLRNQHDKNKFNFKNSINNLNIDFEYDVFYINNKRKVIFKINNFNKNSRFLHNIEIIQEKETIILKIEETEDLKINNNQYYIFDSNEPFNTIEIDLKELDNQSKYKISLNNS